MTTTSEERSVPKVVFTDAEAGAKEFPDSDARRFNYYTPQKRKQTHYEDVTVEVQPDPRHYLAQGWLYGFADGKGGYPLEWTALKAWGSDRPVPKRYPGSGGKGYDWPAHGWHEFRDPNEEWELTLYRYNANVVRQVNQNVDNARQTKAFEQWNRNWVRFVERNVGAWMHVDHGLGLYLYANANRRAPTNMHNNAISVNSMHRIRAAQDLALYNLTLSEEIEGFDGTAHLAAWNDDPAWAGDGRLIHVDCNYKLIVDNLMDLTHETFVHGASIGQRSIAEVPFEVTHGRHSATVTRWMIDVDPPPFWKMQLQWKRGEPAGRVDRWQIIEFQAPSTVAINVAVAMSRRSQDRVVIVDGDIRTRRHGGRPEGADHLGSFLIVRLDNRDAGRAVSGQIPCVHRDQAPVGDRDAMGVAREVGEHRLGSAERLLRIDHPFRASERGEEGSERCGICECCVLTEELETSGLVSRDQLLQEQPPEQCRQYLDAQKVVRSARNPLGAIRRQTTARHHHMHMRMVRQRRAPRVQNRHEADASAQMPACGCDLERGLGRCLEQQIVDHRLVLIGDVADLRR